MKKSDTGMGMPAPPMGMPAPPVGATTARSAKPLLQTPPIKVKVTLEEALGFYGLSLEHLFVRGWDENEKPVYAFRIYPDRVVFVLSSGPKLAYPPQGREHVAFVPKSRRKQALRMAGLVDDEEDDQDAS